MHVPGNGRSLFAILHEPRSSSTTAGVIFLNAGLQNRAGPRRIYVKTARRLSEAGFLSLRVDLPGVGDSHGPAPKHHFDMHDPDHVRSAVDYLAARENVTSIVLIGMCAGARVAFKAAATDARVNAVVSWSVPVLAAPPDMPVSPEGYFTDDVARGYLRHWMRKAARPAAWHDYFASGKTVSDGWSKVWRVAAALAPVGTRDKHGRSAVFLDAVAAYLATGRKALFVYGENDAISRREFEERFPGIAQGRVSPARFIVIPDGDHTFTSVASARRAIGETVSWLEHHYVRDDDAASRELAVAP